MIILWTVLGAGSGHSVSDRNLNSHRENETPMSWLEMRAVWGKASLLEVPVMGGAWSGWSGRRVPGTRVEGAVRSHVDYRKERGIPRECDSEESTDKGRVGDITGLGCKGLNIGSRVRAQHECSCESQFGRRGDCCVCIKEKEHPHSEGLPGRCVCS